MNRLLASGVLALSLAGCAAAPAATGPFNPDVKLDPTQVEVVPPKEYILVTPESCFMAIDFAHKAILAEEAILAADDKVFQALADENLAALKRADAERTAAIAARDALDYDAANDWQADCLSKGAK
jgi:hypothetical protein